MFLLCLHLVLLREITIINLHRLFNEYRALIIGEKKQNIRKYMMTLNCKECENTNRPFLFFKKKEEEPTGPNMKRSYPVFSALSPFPFTTIITLSRE